jgi:hypothetical protein
VHHIEFSVVVLLFVMSVWLVVEAILLARSRTPPTAPLIEAAQPAA